MSERQIVFLRRPCVCLSIADGHWWLRVHTIVLSAIRRDRWLFSLRNGYVKTLTVNEWALRITREERA